MKLSAWEANSYSASQKKNSYFMEPEGSLPRSQEPETFSFASARSIQSRPSKPTSLRSVSVSSFHLRLSLPSSLFRSGFPTKTLYAKNISSKGFHFRKSSKNIHTHSLRSYTQNIILLYF
jgi:hypothetical protein